MPAIGSHRFGIELNCLSMLSNCANMVARSNVMTGSITLQAAIFQTYPIANSEAGVGVLHQHLIRHILHAHSDLVPINLLLLPALQYVIMISTLGGMAVFGINGFVVGPAIAAIFVAVWDIDITIWPETRSLH